MFISYTQKIHQSSNVQQNGIQIHSLSLSMFILPIFLNNSNAECTCEPLLVCYFKDYIIMFKLHWLETHFLLCNILKNMVLSMKRYIIQRHFKAYSLSRLSRDLSKQSLRRVQLLTPTPWTNIFFLCSEKRVKQKDSVLWTFPKIQFCNECFKSLVISAFYINESKAYFFKYIY